MYDMDDKKQHLSATIRSIFITISLTGIGMLVFCNLKSFPFFKEFMKLTEVRLTMAVMGLVWVVLLTLMIVLPF